MTDAQALAVADWRRAVAEMYAAVRADPDPAHAHETWRTGRDELFRTHPASPLPPDSALRESGLPYYQYDAALRFAVPLLPVESTETLRIDISDGQIELRRLGRLALPELEISMDVWWLDQYGGGLFLPLRDGTAGSGTYGGGRYLLDTVKGADLGADDGRLVVDLNFLYHPSCRYSDEWVCPLAPEGNTTPVPVAAGERL